MNIDKLINKNELARELGLKSGSLRTSALHKKYNSLISQLNRLCDYWRRFNGLIKNEWIDVKDKLPERVKGHDYSKKVLALRNDGEMIVCQYLYYMKCWSVWNEVYSEFDPNKFYVTHWMELPKK